MGIESFLALLLGEAEITDDLVYSELEGIDEDDQIWDFLDLRHEVMEGTDETEEHKVEIDETEEMQAIHDEGESYLHTMPKVEIEVIEVMDYVHRIIYMYAQIMQIYSDQY